MRCTCPLCGPGMSRAPSDSMPAGQGQIGLPPRLAIVGACFGGMAAVEALKGSRVHIVLIDETNHHLFQPLLYQVATAALSPADVATATRAMLRKRKEVTILMARATGIDPERRVVHTDRGGLVPFDYLVLATGAGYSFFGNDAWRVYTCVLKSLDDALEIRARLLAAFEQAEQSFDEAEVK